MNSDFCVIIPDRGDRPQFLKHCLLQMERQTVKPDKIYLMNHKPINDKPDIIPRIKEGISRAKSDGFDCCYIIENDDYYPDDYFEKIPFVEYDFIGIDRVIYYHLKRKEYIFINHHKQKIRSSFFCTGFRISALNGFRWPNDDKIFFDLRLWEFASKRGNYKLYHPENMPIGMKHGIGLCATDPHDKKYQYALKDENLEWLKNNVNENSFLFYRTIADNKDNPIPVKQLRNIHSGKDIYVIASGSSMDYVRKEFFYDKITIGVNKIWKFFHCDYVIIHHGNLGQEIIDNGLTLIASHNNCCIPRQKNNYQGTWYRYDHKNEKAISDQIDYSFLDSENSLVTGSTTVIDAMSFACFIGAKSIILCGTDGGIINGHNNLKGYYDDKISTERQIKHTRQSRRLIKEFADVLRNRGIGVYSLNPFTDFNLEGNNYET